MFKNCCQTADNQNDLEGRCLVQFSSPPSFLQLPNSFLIFSLLKYFTASECLPLWSFSLWHTISRLMRSWFQLPSNNTTNVTLEVFWTSLGALVLSRAPAFFSYMHLLSCCVYLPLRLWASESRGHTDPVSSLPLTRPNNALLRMGAEVIVAEGIIRSFQSALSYLWAVHIMEVNSHNKQCMLFRIRKKPVWLLVSLTSFLCHWAQKAYSTSQWSAPPFDLQAGKALCHWRVSFPCSFPS